MNILQEITEQTIKNYVEKNLKRSELRVYSKKVTENFHDIGKFDSFMHYRYAGDLFLVMLGIDDFENDPDIRQYWAAMGYYIFSKGMERYTLDGNGNCLVSREFEHLDITNSRLNLLLEASESIKYTIKLCNYWDNIENIVSREYGDYMRGYEESKNLENMIVFDSYTLSRLGSDERMRLKRMKTIAFGNETLQRYKKNINLDKTVDSGKEMSRKLYKYLVGRFEMEGNFDFS
jgi:hypothetical protein